MVKRSYRVLPRAVVKINQTMRELRVRPRDPKATPEQAIRAKQRFYMVPVSYRGGVAWFKASLEQAPGLEKSLSHEIHIQRAFAQFERQFHPRFDSPSFLRAGGSGKYRWLLRKYWEGEFAGEMFTIYGYRPTVLRKIAPGRFAGVLADVDQMSSFMKNRLRVYRHDVRWYLLDFRHYKKNFFRPVLRHQLNPGWRTSDIQRFEQHLRNAAKHLRRRTTHFSHGDLYPNNVMLVGRRPKIVLFDWELANWNLQAFDSVMVYLLAWRSPNWQKRFRAASFRWLGGGAEKDWQVAQLSLATRFAGYAFARLAGTHVDRYGPLPAVHRPLLRRMYKNMVQKLQIADMYLQKQK